MDIFFVVLIGLCFGSFATVLFHRIPRGLKWVGSRSRCSSCGSVLAVRDLIPLFSWIVNKGRCRQCGAGVPAFYPLVEIVTALLTLAVYLGFKALSE